MKKILSSKWALLFVCSTAFAQNPAPSPGTPVVSAPMKPGECVVACVPGSAGGGLGGKLGGSTVTLGGGTSGGSCQMFCAPPVPTTTTLGPLGGAGGSRGKMVPLPKHIP